jgi:diguanylate cyclase (GGDEF)-like protein
MLRAFFAQCNQPGRVARHCRSLISFCRNLAEGYVLLKATRYIMLASIRLPPGIRKILPYVVAAIAVGIVTLGFMVIYDLLRSKPGTYAMTGIMLVALLAAKWGVGPALFAAMLVNGVIGFYFSHADFAFAFDRFAAWALWLAYTVTSITISMLVGQLSARLRYRVAETQAARTEAEWLRRELLERSQAVFPSFEPEAAASSANLEDPSHTSAMQGVPPGSALLTLMLMSAWFTAVFMTAFEIIKQLVFPRITIWQSHTFTIVFTTLLAILVAFLVGYRLKLLNTRLAALNAELWSRNDDLLSEVRQRQRVESHILHMAHHDALTGLPNRALLEDRIEQAIAQAQRSKQLVAVVFLDLDHFKNINDSHGHQVGDGLLQMAASRLQQCLRKGDSVARLGGDEFVLILSALTEDYDAVTVAQKAIEALQQPFVVEHHELHVSASIGISFYPADGADAEMLLKAADTAMYHAKAQGRGNYQFFTQALNQVTQRRLTLAAQLREALARGEFVLYYQPQVDLETGRIFAAEALLRWHQPKNRLLSCSEFIEAAEETGLIVPIGEWVLRQACRQLSDWRRAGHPQLRIAVNLSARQFYQPHFEQTVACILADNRLSTGALDLELTETMLVEPSEQNLCMLQQLSNMGVQLSLDDFGMGYSSLSYLQRFPISALKIDRSFVMGIRQEPNDTAAIVTTIIAMANSLRLKVIAEGVETPEQANFLKAQGCLAAQGYYYSEPLSAERFSALLRHDEWLAV